MKINKINHKLNFKTSLKTRAFTLIELLVVIAIIGILSGVVIVNLNSAREKGQDAAIKQQVGQIRSATLLYQDTNNGFSIANISAAPSAASAAQCTTASSVFVDAAITRALGGITGNAGSAANCALGAVVYPGISQSWVIISSLRSSSANFWCADSSGIAKIVTSKTAIATAGNDIICP